VWPDTSALGMDALSRLECRAILKWSNRLFRFTLAVATVLSLSVTAPAEEQLCLPDYIGSATIETINGVITTYGQPRKGDELVGFGKQGGTIRFVRRAFPKAPTATQMARKPLCLHRVMRDPSTGVVRGIELGSVDIWMV
jgi:hypothetical protein